MAWDEIGRDPATIRRSVDVFSVATPGTPEPPPGVLQVRGSPDQIAEELLGYGALGFDEVRCNLLAPADAPRTEAIAWMGGRFARSCSVAPVAPFQCDPT